MKKNRIPRFSWKKRTFLFLCLTYGMIWISTAENLIVNRFSVESISLTGPTDAYVGMQASYSCSVETDPADRELFVAYTWHGVSGGGNSADITFSSASVVNIYVEASGGGGPTLYSDPIAVTPASIMGFSLDYPTGGDINTEVFTTIDASANASGMEADLFPVEVIWDSSEGSPGSGANLFETSFDIEPSDGYTIDLLVMAMRGSESEDDNVSMTTVNVVLKAQSDALTQEQQDIQKEVNDLAWDLLQIEQNMTAKEVEKEVAITALNAAADKVDGWEESAENIMKVIDVAEESATITVWVATGLASGWAALVQTVATDQAESVATDMMEEMALDIARELSPAHQDLVVADHQYNVIVQAIDTLNETKAQKTASRQLKEARIVEIGDVLKNLRVQG